MKGPATVFLLITACLLGPVPSNAIQQPPTDRILVPLPSPAVVPDEAAEAAFLRTPAGTRLEAMPGPRWRLRFDALTGRPAVALGGTPWVPGPANDLGDDPDLARRFSEEPLAVLEEKARAFVAANPEIFGARSGELELDRDATGSVLGGRLWFLAFRYLPFGLPAEGAEIVFRVGQGNLIQFGVSRVLDSSRLDPVATVTSDEAVAAASAVLGAGAREREGRVPNRVWVPVREGDRLAYRLSWRVELSLPGDRGSWVAHVDARTAEVLGLEDANRYLCSPEVLDLGRVTGGVKTMLFADPEESRPLGYATMITGAGARSADENGLWTSPGGDASCALAGLYSQVHCVGCQNPNRPLARADATGDVAFSTGGADYIGDGTSTLSGRTAYFHVVRSRAMAKQWISDRRFFQEPLDIYVNIPAVCNAYFDGYSVNFFRKGGGCNNTGEIPGVVQHEWGHGLDQATGAGTGGRGEGLGDHIAFLSSHDPRIGPGFHVGGGSVRVVDEDLVGRRVYPNGCANWDVHCQGQWWSQATWHMARLFRDQFGEATGWRMMEMIFFSSLQGSNTLDPNSATGIYQSYAAVMDDDGDLSDQEIYFATILNDALSHHGLAPSSGLYADASSPPCDPVPVSPTPDITVRSSPVTGRPETVLVWSAVPGATGYEVLRNQLGDRESLLRVGETTDTNYVDPGLVQGATYDYAILPVLSSPFCMARIEALTPVTVDVVELDLGAVALEGAGGADGVWMPGETMEIRPSVRNTSGVFVPPGLPADNVEVSLVAQDPGPFVVEDLAPVGTVDPAQTVEASSPWVVDLPDDPNLCGRTLSFLAAIEADQGCWDDAFSLTVGAGDADIVVDAVSVDDSGEGGNANGVLEPGETGYVFPILKNRGVRTALSVHANVRTFDPRVDLGTSTLEYGDIPPGASSPPREGVQVTYSDSIPCGDSPTLFLDLFAENGCWRAQMKKQAVVRDVIRKEDFETPASTWSVSGGADAGSWVQTNPIDTGLQPGEDTTPDPGLLAFVTGNPPGAPEDGDVDGGCTVLTSPVYDLGGISRATLEYQRFYTLEDVPDDEFLVEISNNAGGSWSELERLTRTQDWSKFSASLDTVLGAPADRLQLRFTACDNGLESLVEAGVDDVVISVNGCEPAEPRPELEPVQWIVDDGIVGGTGDGDGVPEPGETVELHVKLRNRRNAPALSVAGTLTLVGAVSGVRVLDGNSAWPDVPPGQGREDLPDHFLLELDPALPCGTTIPLALHVDYEGSGSQGTTAFSLDDGTSLEVGTLVPGSGPESVVFSGQEDGAGDGPWVHARVRSLDDWEKGTPLGLFGDPDAAYSGTNVWGNDLGKIVNGSPVGGAYGDAATNFLESWPVDLSRQTGTALEFQRWLTLAAGDQARILVGGDVVWESPPQGLQDTGWSSQRLDVSRVADGRSGVTVRFEMETDDSDVAGGWNLDDIQILAVPAEDLCELDPTACGDVTPPAPVGARLRVGWADRSAGSVRLDWTGYGGEALRFNIYRSGDPADLAATPYGVPALPDGAAVPGPAWGEGTGSGAGLTFYKVTALNPCGVEE